MLHAHSFVWFISLVLFSPVFSMSTSMAVVGLSTRAVTKPEASKPFLEALQRCARLTKAEPGCLQFVLGRRADPPADNIFYVHDQFRNAAAYEEHNKTPHFREFLETIKPFLDESSPPVSVQYLCPHDPVERQPPSGYYCLNVESIVKPDFVAEYDKLIISHAANSLKEPACVQFDWGKAEPNEKGHVCYYFHEEYVDKAGFEAHMVTPHFKRFVEFNESKQPYVVPQTVDFFEILDYA